MEQKKTELTFSLRNCILKDHFKLFAPGLIKKTNTVLSKMTLTDSHDTQRT